MSQTTEGIWDESWSRPQRPTDDVLITLRAMCLAILATKHAAPPIPLQCVITLCDELIEARAVASGAVAKLLNEPAKVDGSSLKDRPTDADLEGIAAFWRDIANVAGPSCKIEIQVMPLITLAEELIEFRKMPRA